MWKFLYPDDGNEQAIHHWFHKPKTTDRRLKPEKHFERGMSVCISSQFKETPKRTALHDFLLHLHQSQKCEEDVGMMPIYISNWQDRGSVSIWPPFARAPYSVKFTPGFSWTEVQPGCAALTTVKSEFRTSNCDGKQKWGEHCWHPPAEMAFLKGIKHFWWKVSEEILLSDNMLLTAKSKSKTK